MNFYLGSAEIPWVSFPLGFCCGTGSHSAGLPVMAARTTSEVDDQTSLSHTFLCGERSKPDMKWKHLNICKK